MINVVCWGSGLWPFEIGQAPFLSESSASAALWSCPSSPPSPRHPSTPALPKSDPCLAASLPLTHVCLSTCLVLQCRTATSLCTRSFLRCVGGKEKKGVFTASGVQWTGLYFDLLWCSFLLLWNLSLPFSAPSKANASRVIAIVGLWLVTHPPAPLLKLRGMWIGIERSRPGLAPKHKHCQS